MKVTPAELMALQKRVGDKGAQVHMRSSSSASTATPCKRSDASPYKSKLETSYANYLHALKLAGDITLYRYEQVRLKLMDGVTYVPDFYVRWKDGTEEYHEIKGYARARNQERGVIKLRVAAHTWPHWRFVLVTHARGRWEHQPMVTG